MPGGLITLKKTGLLGGSHFGWGLVSAFIVLYADIGEKPIVAVDQAALLIFLPNAAADSPESGSAYHITP